MTEILDGDYNYGMSNVDNIRIAAAELVKRLGRKLRILGCYPNSGGC